MPLHADPLLLHVGLPLFLASIPFTFHSRHFSHRCHSNSRCRATKKQNRNLYLLKSALKSRMFLRALLLKSFSRRMSQDLFRSSRLQRSTSLPLQIAFRLAWFRIISTFLKILLVFSSIHWPAPTRLIYWKKSFSARYWNYRFEFRCRKRYLWIVVCLSLFAPNAI